jgi:chaperonin cofactor prefoldin
LVEKDKLIDKLVEDSRDLKTKVGALEHTRECLRKTLKETQEELVRLVEAHEKLT